MSWHVERGLRAHHHEDAAALYWEGFGAKLGRVLGPAPRALRLVRRTLRPDHAFCAVDDDGALLGIAGFKTMEGAFVGGGLADLTAVYGLAGALWRATLLRGLERDVENRRFLADGICVAPAARGQGIGAALVEALCQEARARGYAEVRLDVIAENPRARALYERLGFVATATQATGPLRHVFGFRATTVMVRTAVRPRRTDPPPGRSA